MSESVIKNPKGVFKAVKLTNGDFNDLIQEGFYTVYGYTNGPENNTGHVEVEVRRYDQNMHHVLQEASANGYGNVFYRRFKNGEASQWTSWYKYVSQDITQKDYISGTNGSVIVYRCGRFRMLQIFLNNQTMTKNQWNTLASLEDADKPAGSHPVYFPVLNNNASSTSNPLIPFHVGYITQTKSLDIWPYIDGLQNIRATVTYLSANY